MRFYFDLIGCIYYNRVSPKDTPMAKLFFRYSSMNAGKSTSLLQIAHNYREQKLVVALFTAEVDNRDRVGVISSRLGIKADAATFSKDTDFFAVIQGLIVTGKPACILIDEAQFLSAEQVRQLHRAANLLGVPIICFGIRSDFRGEIFEGSSYLLGLADDLEEIKATCACGRKSTMNVRVDEDGKRINEGEQVDIGGNSRYRQVCARCFYQNGV